MKPLVKACLLLFITAALFGQEDFGFGDEGFGFQGAPAAGLSVNLGGEVQAEIKPFFSDMGSGEKARNMQVGDIFSGRLKFAASGSAAEGIINLDLVPVFDGSSPVSLDEAFIRAFFGVITVEGGLRKLSWGRADSFGPLDIINPLDYTDLTKLSDPQSVKLARPMLHAIWAMGSFTKLEAVFIPWFQGHKFAMDGKWMPGQVSELSSGIEKILAETGQGIALSPLILNKSDYLNEIPGIGESLRNKVMDGSLYPDTSTLEYAQAGLRFATSFGSTDFGFQYYFGRQPRPAISGIDPDRFFEFSPSPSDSFHPEAITPLIAYNYYHQIAVDMARVIAGFNLRAEAGFNLTKDMDGSDGAVENPAFVWSLGFDRDLFAGINANLQGTGKIRLFHERIGSGFPLDCEAGTDASSTRITGIISRKFLRDELELKATGLWGIEDRDFLVMPSVIWSRNDVSTQLSAGFFGGDKKGELGQYRDNNFLRLVLSYTF